MDQAADSEHGWLKKSFSIESCKILSRLRIYGSTNKGEFVFAPRYYSDDFSVVLYNPNTNGLRKLRTGVKGNYEFKHHGEGGSLDPYFDELADAMVTWIEAWDEPNPPPEAADGKA
ncbi:unnamed protein product [Eruca vesicaria subsp. sativa]|uniref:F-box associated beta-propeller type 3 domain-containing protein n=1 Tax=Eruca vesicaria subsp. sativa TaxID=29727 RepID=A0ABC8LSK4_ERUVS|nr:unnamed protein product [Eruca vesicaria subsp. sativa]